MLIVVTTTVPRCAASRASSGRERQRRGIAWIQPGQVRRNLPDGSLVQGIREDLGHALFDSRKRPRSRDVHDFVDARVHGIAEVRAVDRVRRHAQAGGVRALNNQAQ